MLLSVFTPTHDATYLHEAHDSLLCQTYSNFEWVIVPNGGLTTDQIPIGIRQHRQVRVIPGPEDISKIGALKRFACSQAEGDVFVELDHDDQLLPTTLARVKQLAADNPCSFIYSDAASFLGEKHQRPAVLYNLRHGWETYEFRSSGLTYTAHRNFPVTPCSLYSILYAPDHVRCWTRSAYKATGGHDLSMTICDDHDLMCRTYLAGVPFVSLDGCGYLYRHHSKNTVKAKNDEIQQTQKAVGDRYLHRMIDEWCRREQLPFADLGTSEMAHKLKVTQDSFSIDLDSNHYGCVKVFNILQRLPRLLIPMAMNELYRILAPGGWLCVAVPDARSDAAFGLDCRSYWSPYTFSYFCERTLADLVPNYIGRFQLVRTFKNFPQPDVHRGSKSLFVFADLCALKGQRQPGIVDI